MIKESKKIDFYTTGRQPSEDDFARISEWIKQEKQRKKSLKLSNPVRKQKHVSKQDSVLSNLK